MRIYRLEHNDGTGPYCNCNVNLVDVLDHDLSRTHPVDFPGMRHIADEPYRYGFAEWTQACDWWGAWGERGLREIAEMGMRLRVYDVDPGRVEHLNRQCVFNIGHARLLGEVPLESLLNRTEIPEPHPMEEAA